MNNDIMQCCKNCEERYYKCHSECAKYKKFKLIMEQEKKARAIEKRMDTAHYEMRYKRRDKVLIRTGKFKAYNNFNK